MRNKKHQSRILTGGNLDPSDSAEMDEFARQAVARGKKATAEAIARMKAAGVPIPTSDGKGGVILKNGSAGPGRESAGSRHRA